MTMVDKKEEEQLQVESLKKNLENVNKEIEMIGKAREEQHDRIIQGKKQIELKKKLHAIALKKFRMLNPAWEFQADEEYNELRKELSDTDHKMEMLHLESQLFEAEARLERFEDQVRSLKDSREILAKQIGEEVVENE